jgi:hypothetical protein
LNESCFHFWFGQHNIVSDILFYYYSPSDFVINFKPVPFAILVHR